MNSRNSVKTRLNIIEKLDLQALNEQESEKLQGGRSFGLVPKVPDLSALSLKFGFYGQEQPMPVEPDGGIGDGGGQPMPVEPDGGIGN